MAEHGNAPIPASIADLAWIEGRWSGTFKNHPVEEHWSSPASGAMMGMFRWIREGKPYFYELLTISEEEGGLVMRIKHFHPDFKGWEEKDDCISFDLVSLEPSQAIWLKRDEAEAKWLLYERQGDRLRAWFEKASEVPDQESRFDYKLM